METGDKIKKPGIVKLIFTMLYLFIFPALLFLTAGTWKWLQGMIFSLWFILMCASVIIYLYRNDPALLNERYRKPGSGDQKAWDKFVVIGLAAGFTGWIFLMPLDAVRSGWTKEFPFYTQCIGLSMLLFSWFLFFRAYADNTFLSPLVRIQDERKQQLVTTGVYGFVRHPMYLAALLMFIGAPLLLSSYCGLIAGGCVIILLAFRTLGEEKMLAKEFPDYSEYKQKVRFRFFPFIW